MFTGKTQSSLLGILFFEPSVGPKNSISPTSFLNSKAENLRVVAPHRDTAEFLYGIQHEHELQSADEPMQIDQKEQNFSNIKEETSEPIPHRSPEAERKVSFVDVVLLHCVSDGCQVERSEGDDHES